MTSYVIRGGEEGKARLRVVSQALWPTTRALLERIGVTPGMACLDVGCGGGDVALALAALVGPGGHVTGIDMDGVKIQLAQTEAAQAGLANVTFLTQNFDAFDEAAAYDLVYARFLLTHLRDPLAALERMVNATKPGGVVIIEDLYHGDIFSYPACPALQRHIALYNQVVQARGADPEIGPKLPALFRQAGLQQIQLTHAQPAALLGPEKDIHWLTLENIALAVIAAGLATAEEIQDLRAELADFAQNPQTIMSFPRVFQVWAQRP